MHVWGAVPGALGGTAGPRLREEPTPRSAGGLPCLSPGWQRAQSVAGRAGGAGTHHGSWQGGHLWFWGCRATPSQDTASPQAPYPPWAPQGHPWCSYPLAGSQGQPPGKGCPFRQAGGSFTRLPQADLLAPGSLSEALSVLRQTQGACLPASRNTASLVGTWAGRAPRQAGEGGGAPHRSTLVPTSAWPPSLNHLVPVGTLHSAAGAPDGGGQVGVHSPLTSGRRGSGPQPSRVAKQHTINPVQPTVTGPQNGCPGDPGAQAGADCSAVPSSHPRSGSRRLQV